VPAFANNASPLNPQTGRRRPCRRGPGPGAPKTASTAEQAAAAGRADADRLRVGPVVISYVSVSVRGEIIPIGLSPHATAVPQLDAAGETIWKLRL
jgi:hypothetical protein